MVTAGTETSDGFPISSRRTAVSRLETGLWELFARTPNRDHVKTGDNLVVYATRTSRRECGAFIGSAVVTEAVRDVKTIRRATSTHYKPAPSSAVLLRLGQVRVFKTPVTMELVRNRLSFIPKHNKWGVVFLGGCVRITAGDFNALIESANTSGSETE